MGAHREEALRVQTQYYSETGGFPLDSTLSEPSVTISEVKTLSFSLSGSNEKGSMRECVEYWAFQINIGGGAGTRTPDITDMSRML